MLGCQFCRMEENGDYGSDLTSLIHVEEKRGDIKCTDKESKETYHDDAFNIISEYDIKICGDLLMFSLGDMSEISRKINFCPICGREL